MRDGENPFSQRHIHSCRHTDPSEESQNKCEETGRRELKATSFKVNQCPSIECKLTNTYIDDSLRPAHTRRSALLLHLSSPFSNQPCFSFLLIAFTTAFLDTLTSPLHFHLRPSNQPTLLSLSSTNRLRIAAFLDSIASLVCQFSTQWLYGMLDRNWLAWIYRDRWDGFVSSS
jgi:hypothetical protein